jgi:DNA-binding MarR family transcriptional regulator
VSDADGHPAQRLDDVVHQRVRLGILAVLDQADRADFTYLRKALGLTDGNLSRHLSVLEDAGYLETTKTFEGRKPRTWVRSTRQGKTALADEMAALRELVTRYDTTVTAVPAGDEAGTA